MPNRSDANAAAVELLKGAAANPGFDPLSHEDWSSLLDEFESIRDRLQDAMKPASGTKGSHLI